MAYTLTDSDWMNATPDDLSGRPSTLDHTGKIRVLHGKCTQGAAAGDIGSQMRIAPVPAGRLRFLPYLARFSCSAWGASATISLGLTAYYNASIPDPIAQTAEDDVCLGAAVSATAAQIAALFGTPPLKFDIYSRGGGIPGALIPGSPYLIATVAGAVIPIGATLEVLMPYVQE